MAGNEDEDRCSLGLGLLSRREVRRTNAKEEDVRERCIHFRDVAPRFVPCFLPGETRDKLPMDDIR